MSEHHQIDHCRDGTFGPVVNPVCRGGFDFTLMFQDAVFSLLPAACFAILAVFRMLYLFKGNNRVKQSSSHVLKLVLIGILTVVATIQLAFTASEKDAKNRISIPAAVANLVAAIELVPLSHLEHFKSVRPSLLICSFISISTLLDIARLRSAWLQSPSTGSTACLTASFVTKLLVLAAESLEKRRWLNEPGKSKSTESTGGPVNRALFLWLNKFLMTGWHAVLGPDTLPPVDERLALESVFPKLQHSWDSTAHTQKYALLLAIMKAFKGDILATVIPRLCLVGLSIAQPFVIGQTVTFLADRSSSPNIGYGLIGAFSIVFISTAISTALYQHLGYRVTTMLRGGLIAAIYSHMMSLPAQSVGESSGMALIGSDTESFADSFHGAITETWADVLQLFLAVYLLARIIGAICVAPILVAVAFTCLSFQIGKMIAGKQRKCFEATQSRINFTTEILSRIRDVKVLGLSDVLSRAIADLRDQELELSKSYRRVNVMKICLVNIPMFLAQFVVFAAYGIAVHVRGTGALSVSETVTSLSLVNLLLIPLRSLLYAIPDTFSALSCLRRIQEFLLQTPRSERRTLRPSFHATTPSPKAPHAISLHNLPSRSSDIELPVIDATLRKSSDRGIGRSLPSIVMKSVECGWEDPSETKDYKSRVNTRRITFATPQSAGSLTIIIGPVGCGKSTILTAILGETTLLNGEVSMTSDRLAYCAQDPWLVNGSIRQNIVGDSTDVFDPEWYSTVIHACALDVDLSQSARGDQEVVGSKGVKLSGGQKQRIALARAIYSRRKLVILDDVLSGLDNATRSSVFDRVCSSTGVLRRAGCTIVMAMHHASPNFLSEADHIVMLANDGRIVQQGTFDYISCSLDRFEDLELVSKDTSDGHSANHSNNDKPEDADAVSSIIEGGDATIESPLRRPELSVWSFYFKSMGWTSLALLGVFLSAEGGFGAFRYVWLTWWSASGDAPSASRLGYWIGLYSCFGLVEIAGLFAATYFTWVILVPSTSAKMHSLVLAATFSAPVAYLSNTDAGLLVNRFGQDMRLIDLVLPVGFISTGFHLFGSLAQAGIAIAALPYLAPTIPFVLAVLALIQRFYLRTSSQLRLLEIETKAPVYTHFIESLNGVVTVRAFGWTASVLGSMFALLDANQRPYYLLLSVQRWLVLVLNLVVAALVIILVGLGVALRDRVSPGLMGTALVMMSTLGQMMADLIQSWTSLEDSLGAISRVKTFSEKTPREHDVGETGHVGHHDWPVSGAVEFTRFSARHDDASDLVLRDIDLRIQPGQRVGICGRTGSGKSSLLMSLLRMVQVEAGRVTIDGEDLANLGPSHVRSRVSCLTQDPFIFSDTIRRNLDPLSERSDEDVAGALRAVGLWDTIASSLRGGGDLQADGAGSAVLESNMDENTLSHGQRQLFSIARTLLRKSRLLLLDEPTSRLDAETHAKVQAIIRSQFEGCTTIMVAHRLDSLLDFDHVVVMEAGRVLEAGAPGVLLADGDSAFSRLLRGE